MPYITLATLLLLAVGGMLSLYRQLQMLQQNSYSLSGYFKWVTGSYVTELALSAISYCLITLCMMKQKEIICLCVAAILFLARIFLNVKTQKKSTQKLLFTARVKRHYVTAIIILGALIITYAMLNEQMAGNICRIVLLLLAIVSPVLTFISWLITYPIEKLVQKRNTNTAE